MTSQKLNSLRSSLYSYADKRKAVVLSRFFKTGNGEYAEGDTFLGITVPNSRKVAQTFNDLSLTEIEELLHSSIHEERLVALLILITVFKKSDERKKRTIFDFYIHNAHHINNWDLVDLSAPHIIGGYLADQKDRTVLYKLAKSTHLFEKRIAIIATFYFIIKQQQYKDTFVISEILLHDKHDLIHKAVGWMLREVGKRVSEKTEEIFLQKHYKKMPRTMLRYAIERFDEKKRKRYLLGTI